MRRRCGRYLVGALAAVLTLTALGAGGLPAAAAVTPAAMVAGAAQTAPRISAGADVVVGEGDGFVDLPVTLSAPGQSVVTVNFNTVNVTAGAGSDYSCPLAGCATGVLTFAPGETTKTVRVAILDDATPEGMETFVLNLSNPSADATIARANLQVAIVDNDTVVASPRVFVRDGLVDESAGTVSIPVILGGPAGRASNKTVHVGFATSDGTAKAGSDYTAASGTLSFAPGQTVKDVVVAITDDKAAESAERFTVVLSSPVNATIGDGTGVVLIGANDATRVAQPRISAGADVVVGEGDGFVDLPVTLSAPGQSVVTVNFNTVNVTAGAGSDYSCPLAGCATGVLTFAPGETTKTVRVAILDDATPEGMETFVLNLSNPSADATIARANLQVAIVDNDTVVASPRVFVRDGLVDESAGTVSIPVILGGPAGRASNKTVHVGFATSDGTAKAGSDYTAASGTLSFAPGQTVKDVVVAITDDKAAESAERFTVVLSSPVNATIGDGTGVVLIGANDATRVAQPRISAGADVVVGEGDGFVDLPVTLSAPGQSVVTVNFNTVNVTAGAGSDYSCPLAGCATGVLTFAPGETTKTVRVAILDDATPEGMETFVLNLSNPSADATIARANLQVAIVDNDTVVASPRVFVRDGLVDESAGTVSIPVILGGPAGRASNKTVHVGFATSDGTAKAGSDYTAASGTLSFAPGQTVKDVVVAITDDKAAESAERFTVVLSSPVNATIGDGTGVVLIGANDATRVAQPRISAGADVVVGEGDGFVDLPVTLSAPGQSVVTVNFNTVNVTAGAGSDYSCPLAGCATGVLTFAPGETTKTVRVAILDDATPEGMETFVLNLSNPSADATIARPTLQITIKDND